MTRTLRSNVDILTLQNGVQLVSPDLYINSTNAPFSMDKSLIDSFCEDIEKFQPKILAVNPIYF